MTLKFKDNKLPANNKDRLKYLYRLQENLRIYHNIKAKQFKDKEITEKEFRRFQNGWFHKRNSLICGKIVQCKNNLSDEEKLELLDYDEEEKKYGSVKNKEDYKKDDKVKVSIEDIEEV